jgi:PA14 domain
MYTVRHHCKHLGTQRLYSCYKHSLLSINLLLLQSTAQINFSWGTGAITPYGRDYVSARWTDKLLAPARETYTSSGSTDDACRVYLKQRLILHTWQAVQW